MEVLKMLKVVLVDDEPLITEGLKALINWEDYGFEVINTFENGMEALQFIKEHDVDLLITDIVMPHMTGLQLIENLKEVKPQLKSIILSGYEEFSYVKKGIKLGIENYLIKPVDEEELEETIKNISAQAASVNKKQSAEANFLKDNTIWRLLHNDIKQEEWDERVALYAERFLKREHLVLIVDLFKVQRESLLNKLKAHIESHFNALTVLGTNGELVVIMSEDDEATLNDAIKRLRDDLKGLKTQIGTFYIAAGQAVKTVEAISDSYFKAREFSLYQIVLEPDSIITPATHIDRYELLRKQQSYKTDIVKAIHESKEATNEVIEAFYTYLAGKQKFLVPAVSRKYTIDLVTYIHHSIQDVKHYHHTIVIEKLVRASSNEEIKSILVDYCNELIDAINETDEKRSPIIKDVLEYIHVSYAKELSLKTLSQRFHVNSIYLGQLFQKEMGIVFSEYINQLRIEKAKELLKTTHFTAGEIGRKVGYSDTTYFYKQFKKYVSVTPTEWRKV